MGDLAEIQRMIAGLQSQWGNMQQMLADDNPATATQLPSQPTNAANVPAIPHQTQQQHVPTQQSVQSTVQSSVPPTVSTMTSLSSTVQPQSDYSQQYATMQATSPQQPYQNPYSAQPVQETYRPSEIQYPQQQQQYQPDYVPKLPEKATYVEPSYTPVPTLPAYPDLSSPSTSSEPADDRQAILMARLKALQTANLVKDQAIKQNRTAIDIAFILDLTKSMDPWLDVTRQKIRQITSTLAQKYPQSIARVAFIGYKDFDKHTLLPYYVVHDFDTAERILEKIEGLQCNGGDDFCEDVLGAFAQLSSLNWRAKTRLVIFVADAPAHHEYFHDCGPHNDRFHNTNDPAGRGPHTAEELMRYMANNEIEIHAFKIPIMGQPNDRTDKTSKMHMRFKEILNRYGSELYVHNLDEGPEKFLPNVLKAVSSSVIRSSMR